MQRNKRFVVPSVGGATRLASFWQKFSKTQKKSVAELCQILRMVTIEIVINSTRVMGVRVAISCRYPSWDDAFVSSFALPCAVYTLQLHVHLPVKDQRAVSY